MNSVKVQSNGDGIRVGHTVNETGKFVVLFRLEFSVMHHLQVPCIREYLFVDTNRREFH